LRNAISSQTLLPGKPLQDFEGNALFLVAFDATTFQGQNLFEIANILIYRNWL
jgi:hypothetical protein